MALTAMSFRPVDDDQEDVYMILFGESEKAIKDGDYDNAILRIKEAISIEPNNPQNVLLLSNLGIIYGRQDKDSLALDAFDKAYTLAPNMVTVLENRALQHLKMKNDAAAYRDFGAVIERDSCNATARFYHGMMSLFGRDIDTAKADITVLEALDPDGYDTSVAMALLCATIGEYRKAVDYYKNIIAAEPLPDYYGGLAMCYLQLGELSDASATISEGLAKYPDDAELYYYRAWLNRDSYLMKDARTDAQIAIALGANPEKVNSLFK